jgi:hypothetical protein
MIWDDHDIRNDWGSFPSDQDRDALTTLQVQKISRVPAGMCVEIVLRNDVTQALKGVPSWQGRTYCILALSATAVG